MTREQLNASLERYGRVRTCLTDALCMCEEDLGAQAADPAGPPRADLELSAQLTDLLADVESRIGEKQELLRSLP